MARWFRFTLRRPPKEIKFKVYDLVLGKSSYGSGVVVGQLWRNHRGKGWTGYDMLHQSFIDPRPSLAECRQCLETVVSLSVRMAGDQFMQSERFGRHVSEPPQSTCDRCLTDCDPHDLRRPQFMPGRDPSAFVCPRCFRDLLEDDLG